MNNQLAVRLINEAYLSKSTFLDIGNCNLTAIPEQILTLGDSLQHINFGDKYWSNHEYKPSANNLAPNLFHSNEDSLLILLKLKNLTSLSLESCEINDKEAEYIGRLSSLTDLDVGRNNIFYTGAEHISRLSSLNTLILAGNKIRDKGAKYVSRLSCLKTLVLDSNNIGNSGAEYIRKMHSLISLDVANNKIDEKGAEYISNLSSLASLNLAYNSVGEKGAEHIGRLSSLTSLNLRSNNIGERGTKHIGRLFSLKSLSLEDNDITDHGVKYLNEFTCIYDLNLVHNKIREMGAECISKISSLTSLNLDFNKIEKKGVEHISKLPSLVDLSIRHNDIGNDEAKYLMNLSQLTSLNLGNNYIGESGAEYISHLSLLSFLNLENNYIEDNGAKCLTKLSKLTSLNLGANNISGLGAKFIGNISTLTFLNLENNHIGDEGAKYISKLSSLTSLNVQTNKIEDKGATYISEISSLNTLNLANNKITKFNVRPSSSLTTLKLQNNLFRAITSDLIDNTDLEIDVEVELKDSWYYSGKIFLNGNPIESPPLEVIARGRDSIIEYLTGNLRPLNECKLIFVGDGGVGKTTLMKRLVYEEFVVGEKSTHGINKIAWKGFENEKGEPINVNLWDFGGQHIQHSLHQFFFTERVVYVLVLNPRNDEKAGYWLDQIDKLGRNSQIIIVYNWKERNDSQADFLTNFRELRKTYKYLPEPIILSCATGEGMPEFKMAIKNAVLANEGLKTQYPEIWFRIKQRLESGIPIEKHYIKYDQYETWCKEVEYNDPERRRNLLKILDSVGSIVFFDKPVLNELQVLNPEWISTGAYAIITAEVTRRKKGHLTWDDLREIFSEEKEIFSDKHIKIRYHEQQFKFILQLMLDYRLCQKNPLVEHEYLFPGAFGEKPERNYDISGGRHFRLKFHSQFEMLVMHQFIAKNIPHIVSNDYWNSGIYFKHATSQTYALVETNQYSKEINCWINGDNIRGMWEVIRNDFRDIFNMYHNFPVDEEVDYVRDERNVFLKYDEMLAALNNGVSVIPYDPKTGLKDIDVLQVLELFESPEQTKKHILYEHLMVEVNPQIIVSPQFTNSPVINSNNITSLQAKESEFVKPKINSKAEDAIVKKWKNKAVLSFVLSLIVTVFLVIIYIKKWVIGVNAWSTLEKNDIAKWIGIPIAFIWNSVVGKALYDRIWDPTKEKAYRDKLRK